MEEFNIRLIEELLHEYSFEHNFVGGNGDMFTNNSNSLIVFNKNKKTTLIKINDNLVFNGILKTYDDLEKILAIFGFIKNQEKNISAKDILYCTKDKYNIGSAWQLTEHIILEAMEEYSKLNQVKQIKDINNYIVFIDTDDGLMQLSNNFNDINSAITYSNNWKSAKTYVFGEIKIDK